ncbi:signal peptidase I [Ktedonosporobacter rubrisoli]|uniref:signal peptidase I n=1 Tax=Ktedonosporobacter rubrisoli TaxID=2509675 RepID=UPI001F5CEF8B|nr:signal peptidase I [Ktedonosporobacter rubrisoli]
MDRRKSQARTYRLVRHCIELTVFLLLIVFVMRMGVQNFHIDGPSMEPTLHDQEYILVNKAAYLLQQPARGDIIVFEYPLNPQQYFIKRIIAIPGDVVSVIGTTVIVNGVTLHEPYINPDDPYNPYQSFKQRIIEPDEYFVLGDNRANSSDSRAWGYVPFQNIIGKVMMVYWPIGANNLGALPDVSKVFAHVHQ